MRSVTIQPQPPVLRVPDHGDAQHGPISLVSGDEELAAFSIDSAS